MSDKLAKFNKDLSSNFSWLVAPNLQMGDMCFYCSKGVSSAAVSCSTFQAKYHKSCADRYVSDVSGVYKCCRNSRPTSPAASGNNNNLLHPNMANSQNTGKAGTKKDKDPVTALSAAIKEQTESVNVGFSQCENRMKKIEDNLAMIENVQVAVNTLSSRVDALEQNKSDSDTATLKCALEAKEQLARANHLILYGIAEPLHYELQTDTQHVLQLVSVFESIDVSKATASRIGKPNPSANGPRPVLVKLQSNNDVAHILRNWKKLPKGISASSDRTQLQRDHFRKLKKQADEHNSEHPNDRVVIKFNKGIPSSSKIDPKSTFRESTSSE